MMEGLKKKESGGLLHRLGLSRLGSNRHLPAESSASNNDGILKKAKKSTKGKHAAPTMIKRKSSKKVTREWMTAELVFPDPPTPTSMPPLPAPPSPPQVDVPVKLPLKTITAKKGSKDSEPPPPAFVYIQGKGTSSGEMDVSASHTAATAMNDSFNRRSSTDGEENEEDARFVCPPDDSSETSSISLVSARDLVEQRIFGSSSPNIMNVALLGKASCRKSKRYSMGNQIAICVTPVTTPMNNSFNGTTNCPDDAIHDKIFGCKADDKRSDDAADVNDLRMSCQEINFSSPILEYNDAKSKADDDKQQTAADVIDLSKSCQEFTLASPPDYNNAKSAGSKANKQRAAVDATDLRQSCQEFSFSSPRLSDTDNTKAETRTLPAAEEAIDLHKSNPQFTVFSPLKSVNNNGQVDNDTQPAAAAAAVAATEEFDLNKSCQEFSFSSPLLADDSKVNTQAVLHNSCQEFTFSPSGSNARRGSTSIADPRQLSGRRIDWWNSNKFDTASSPTVVEKRHAPRTRRTVDTVPRRPKERQRELQRLNEQGQDWFVASPAAANQAQQEPPTSPPTALRPTRSPPTATSTRTIDFGSSNSNSNNASNTNNNVTQSNELVQIYPGVHVPLRTAQETESAIHRDFYTSAQCLGCDHGMFCIRNASYVICPSCKFVTSLENDSGNGNNNNGVTARHGLGMGFTGKTLFETKQDSNNLMYH